MLTRAPTVINFKSLVMPVTVFHTFLLTDDVILKDTFPASPLAEDVKSMMESELQTKNFKMFHM
jgi:hypothetical protein